MPPTTIFARVQPKSIKVTERYYYETWISKNTSIQISEENGEVKDPQGVLEITFPYGGTKFFPIEAIKDIKRQAPNLWDEKKASDGAVVNALVGYLFFSDYDDNTDLEAKLNLHLHNGILPLNIPIVDDQLLKSDILNKDEYSCIIKQTYKPSQPITIPVGLTVNIFDEDTLDELGKEIWEDFLQGDVAPQKNTPKAKKMSKGKFQEIAKALAQKENFKRSLNFDFCVKVNLPRNVGCEHDNNPPKLDRMSIKWPLIISSKQIFLERVDTKEKLDISYDPEKGELWWRNVAFIPGKESEGTGLFNYHTPTIRLAIEYPGELYKWNKPLEGKCDIKIPQRTLSDLEVIYFDASGQKGKTQSEMQADISLNFKLNTQDCFARRIFSPYQMLQFEGVVLDAMRVNDIKNVLEDFGFITKDDEASENLSKYRRHVIAGVRRQGIEELELWMLAEGRPSLTVRERRVQPDHTFKTRLDAGHMIIHMRGRQLGSMSDLISIMHNVQERLNEQFKHVSTVD